MTVSVVVSTRDPTVAVRVSVCTEPSDTVLTHTPLAVVSQIFEGLKTLAPTGPRVTITPLTGLLKASNNVVVSVDE